MKDQTQGDNQHTTFLEQRDKPFIQSPETDFKIKELREDTFTTDVTLRLIAIIYAYMDKLTGNSGFNALELGAITKKWEHFWYKQIQYWKQNHESVLAVLLGRSPEEAEKAFHKL